MKHLLKLISFWFVLIGFLLFFLGGVMHEKVHVAIFEGYGIDSKIEYFRYFPDMATVGEEPCPTEECELAHNINEIVSYNLDSFYLLIYVGLTAIIFILENKGNKDEN